MPVCIGPPSAVALRIRAETYETAALPLSYVGRNVNVRKRSPEGWIALSLLLRGLEESQRVILRAGDDRYIVGYAVLA